MEPVHKTILGMHISNEREYLSDLLSSKYGKHTVYTDGRTWYPHACNFLHLKHYLHFL